MADIAEERARMKVEAGIRIAQETADQHYADAMAGKDRVETAARLQRERIDQEHAQRARELEAEMDAAAIAHTIALNAQIVSSAEEHEQRARKHDAEMVAACIAQTVELDAQIASGTEAAAQARRAHAQRLAAAHELAQEQLADLTGVRDTADAQKAQVAGIAEQLERLVPEAECQVCYETCKVTQGVSCPLPRGDADIARGGLASGSHFLCLDCFSDCVTSQSSEDVMGLTARNAQIVCAFSGSGCQAVPFPDRVVARMATPEAYAAYEAAKERLRESVAAQCMEHDLQVRLARELAERARLTEFELAVRAARKHITDEILTRKCPRCRRAWIDFVGCCALTCGGCGCAFCAFCETDCGTDAHGHANNCRYGSGLYGHAAVNAAHKRLRTERLAVYLPGLEATVRAEVLRTCQQDLADCSLRAGDFK